MPALNQQQYNPQLRGYAMCTLLLERVYDVLRNRESLVNPVTSDLYASIDVVRRLADT